METPNRLYHTKRSVSKTLGEFPDESGVMEVLQKAVKRGLFEHGELDEKPLEHLLKMEEAVVEIIEQIKAMRVALDIKKIRRAIAERLLFLRAFIAFPLILFKDPDDELFAPNITLNSHDIQYKLEIMLITIRNQKSRFTQH